MATADIDQYEFEGRKIHITLREIAPGEWIWSASVENRFVESDPGVSGPREAMLVAARIRAEIAARSII
ncbi:hypothetical protein [Cupriavidus basilensis]|uniref:hypothetical protein n=1 Tax=Cupriavidus basilensis TaxID=68895 RepID=UPI0039F6B926